MGLLNSKPSVQQMLHNYSDSLVPSPEYYRKGNQLANEIFDLVRHNRRDVARCLVGGGIGKRTAISESDDFDLYIFLNNHDYLPQTLDEILLPQTLDEIEDILGTKYANVRIINETTLRLYMNEIKFDISIGFNLEGFFTDQRKATLTKLWAMDNPLTRNHIYGPSLSEYAVEFVRGCSPFEHQIIRIAKRWNKSVNVDGYIAGRSLLIEMIAIWACRETAKNDLFLAIERFLELMAKFQDLNIKFNRFHSDSWFGGIGGNVPKEILNQRPLVLDPVNPFNNLAHITQSQMYYFARAGQDTLLDLRSWKTDPSRYPTPESIFKYVAED